MTGKKWLVPSNYWVRKHPIISVILLLALQFACSENAETTKDQSSSMAALKPAKIVYYAMPG